MSYFAEDKALFQRLAAAGIAPKVAYDIGAANTGWSVTVSEGLPAAEHHLFEPLARHEEYKSSVDYHLSINPLWHLHEIALSDNNGEVDIHVGGGAGNATWSTILDIEVSGNFPKQIRVPQWRLDDYAETNDLSAPDFVKIDTQGSEHLIIHGGANTIAKAKTLLIESWLYRGYGPQTPLLGDIIDLVTPLGFFLFEFAGNARDDMQTMVSVDAVFLKPEIASILSAHS